MFKRTFTVLALTLAIAVGVAIQAHPAQAQEQTYYTYVSEWAVPRSQWAAFEKEAAQANLAMQRFVADGTIIAWGNSSVSVHTEDSYTHIDWFTANSRAGILKVLDSLRPSATGGAYASVTKHQDYFLHTLVHGGKTSSGATGFLRVAFWQAKPGRGDELVEHFKKYIKPILDSEVADGTILMYNFDAEDLHTAAPGGYNLAVIFPSGEAMDKYFARLEAGSKENPAIGQVLSSLTVNEAHRDLLAKVTSYQHK